MYEAAIFNGSTDPIARNNLGFILVDHEIDIERGVRLIEEAVASAPDQAEYRDSLAWAYLRQGRLEAARDEIERAIQMARDGGAEPPARHLEHHAQIHEAIRLRDRRGGRRARE
jgi:tetratricopeptide (TPR) repeat protein